MNLLPSSAWLLEVGVAACGSTIDHAPLLGSLFLAGLAGSITHCGGMCGPFVMAQVSQRLAVTALEDTTAWTRVSGAALAPYHLGRLTTYSLLGAAAGGVGAAFVGATQFKWLLS